MTESHLMIWRELQKRATPSDMLATVNAELFATAVHLPVGEIVQCVHDLLSMMVLIRLSDRDLTALERHTRLRGDFLLWEWPAATAETFRVLSSSELRQSLLARREQLQRRLQSIEGQTDGAPLPPLPPPFTGARAGRLVAAKHALSTLIALGESGDRIRQCAARYELTGEDLEMMPSTTDGLVRLGLNGRNSRDAVSQGFEWNRFCALICHGAEFAELAQKHAILNEVNSLRADLAEKQRVLAMISADIELRDAPRRMAIPKQVQQEVWRRDNGRCVQCGSQENLEYDHVIPVSKGGATTTRNTQLLCEVCNRTKSNRI
jgi:5-methylcytosine-specific restriction endonuclease McrA